MNKRIFLLGIPHHSNLGDSAIAYAEERFIKNNYRNSELFFFPQENLENRIDELKKIISDDDIIFMQGGGNMGCEYIITEIQRRKIVQAFPNNKIVFFPLTIYFKNTPYEQTELKKSEEIYSSHKNLTILAREEKSFEIMKEHFKNNRIIYTPDIVTYLNETEPRQKRSGALMIMRRDREKILDNSQEDYIKDILTKYGYEITVEDNVRGDKVLADEERIQRLEELWDLYRKAEIVVTDRLHGMIFSAITSTPCIALNNYNYKLSASSKWFERFNYIEFINDSKDFERSLNKLKSIKEFDKYNNTFAIEYFNQILMDENKLLEEMKKSPIRVLGMEEALKKIKEEKKSISRFGDGEMNIILGIKDIKFQKYTPYLSERLREILTEKQDFCYIGIPEAINNLNNLALENKAFWIKNMCNYRDTWMEFLNYDMEYIPANITRPYIRYKDRSNCGKYFELLKDIWKDRDVVICEGEQTGIGVGNDLLNQCKSVKRIICPAENAFKKYEQILNRLKKENKNSLILIALGPTATVLAYDLAKQGYQALDIGHVDIEYEWFLRNATKREKIENKYTNEVKGGNQTVKIEDEKYLKQIIEIIK